MNRASETPPHGSLPRTPNALSVDLEDWYQGLTSTSRQIERWPAFEDRVVPATRRLLDLLRRHDTRATFFVLGYVADHHPSLVRDIAAEGHELALHGYHHHMVYALTPDQFRAELARGRQALETAAPGCALRGYRAPMYSLGGAPWALEVLEEAGFAYDSSLYPAFGLLRRYLHGHPSQAGAAEGDPRFPHRLSNGLVEVPLTTLRLAGVNLPIAGGVYMRLLPYRLLRWALRRVNAAGQPAVLYLHPWDLDPNQPRVPLTVGTLRERFTHYVNLGGTEAKLHRLLHDFRFVPVATLLARRALLQPEVRSP